uniref:Uncharacterized protein n=1 Tax=Parascaris equorum TaxID=6256 RepID=A0A914RHM7_PAREQ
MFAVIIGERISETEHFAYAISMSGDFPQFFSRFHNIRTKRCDTNSIIRNSFRESNFTNECTPQCRY